MNGWDHNDYAALIGTEVTLTSMDSRLDTTVPATVSACSDPVRRGDLVSYSVTVLAGPGASAEQGLYSLTVEGRDPEMIFLVPVREVRDRLEYEAVFNQSVGTRSDL